MERYVEVALGTPVNRGRAVHINEIGQLQLQAQKNSLELYRSYYFFDQTLIDHLNAYKTVRGFHGTPFIDFITLDIDKNGSTDAYVHQRAIGIYNLLREFEVSETNIRPYYSGSGYHFVVPNLWNFRTPEEVKETLLEQFTDCDNIYDKARLIRVANTINFKTQRYKIPLSIKELLHSTSDEILKLAQAPRLDFKFEDFELDQHLETTKIKQKFVVTEQPAMVIDEGVTPVVTCMQKLYNSGPVQGKRHTSMMRMVSAFKRGGVPRIGIEGMMATWTKGEMEIGEVRKIVGDVFEKNYMYGCHDEIMEAHCDTRCMFYAKKSFNSAIPKNTDSMEVEIRKGQTGRSGKIIELGAFLEQETPFLIEPEELVIIEGDTGLGKSALAQNIAVNEKNLMTLYLNFECGERLMYRRSLQIAHGKTKFDIIQHYSDPNAVSLSDAVKQIHMVSDRINIHTLEQLLVSSTYNVLVVDTLECFITPGITEITPKTEHIAHELKRIAKKYKLIILAIHHISKGSIVDSQGKTKRLTVHSGKGSSAIEQEADKVILLEATQTPSLRRISSAKARDEAPFNTYMTFDAERTFRFIKEKMWTSNLLSETDTSTSPGLVTDSPLVLPEGLRLLQ